MITPPFLRRARKLAAFSLVEVTIALGITATSLVAVFGLLPLGLNTNQTSIEQTAAANIARSIIADLRSSPATSSTSPLYGFEIPAAGGVSTISNDSEVKPQALTFAGEGQWIGSSNESAPSSAPGAVARYRAAVGFLPPANGERFSTSVRIVISWPGIADGVQRIWPKNFAGSYEVVTALDRN